MNINHSLLKCPNCDGYMIPWGGRVSGDFCSQCGCSLFTTRDFSKLSTNDLMRQFSRVTSKEIRAGRKYCPIDGNGMVAVAGHYGPFVTELICHKCHATLIYPDDLEKIIQNPTLSDGKSIDKKDLSKASDRSDFEDNIKMSKRKKMASLITASILVFTITLGMGMANRTTTFSPKAEMSEFCNDYRTLDGDGSIWWCQSSADRKYQVEKISCSGVYLGREIEKEYLRVHLVTIDDKVCYLQISDAEDSGGKYKMYYVGNQIKN